MKKPTLWIATCIVIFGGAFGIACLLSMFERTPTEKLDPSDPKYDEMLCGPVSLAKALGRLGISTVVNDLASQCEVTSEGIMLTELERVANGAKEAGCRVKRLDWDGLRRFDGTAVLFVNGDHFVAADPRETPQSGTVKSDAVRIYDEGKPARWMTREELAKIWSGRALTIERRRPYSPQTGGPRIEWDECYIDKGVLEPNSIARYAFEFRNVGGSDLTIGNIKRSCGCTTYTLTSKRIAPGQAGVLEADCDLHGREGYRVNRLIVQTNDTTSPVSVLRMAAGVPKKRALSSESLSLADLPRGGQVKRGFYASDPGFEGFKIRDISFVPTTGNDLSKHLTCSITYDLLGDDVRRVARLTGYRGEPEDYMIQFALEAGEKCPVGRFEGEIHVVAEAGAAVSTHKVIVKGAVVQDVHPVPGVALITLDGEGAGNATVQLRSHAEKDFKIVETWADENSPIKIEPADGPQVPAGKYILSTLMPAVIPGAAPIDAAAFFKLKNGAVVRVPIAIFKPPQ